MHSKQLESRARSSQYFLLLIATHLKCHYGTSGFSTHTVSTDCLFRLALIHSGIQSDNYDAYRPGKTFWDYFVSLASADPLRVLTRV